MCQFSKTYLYEYMNVCQTVFIDKVETTSIFLGCWWPCVSRLSFDNQVSFSDLRLKRRKKSWGKKVLVNSLFFIFFS